MADQSVMNVTIIVKIPLQLHPHVFLMNRSLTAKILVLVGILTLSIAGRL